MTTRAYYVIHREACLRDARERGPKYYRKHRSERLAYAKAYREQHRDKVRTYQKAYRQRNRERLLNRQREYRSRNSAKAAAYQVEWYERHKPRILKMRKDHYVANRDAVKARVKKWAAENPERVRVAVWERRHPGITRSQRDAMIADQGGLCLICYRPFGDRPHTDHDHVTGQTRGILCHNCNRGIGYLGDSVDLLTAAIAYLQRYALAARVPQEKSRG